MATSEELIRPTMGKLRIQSDGVQGLKAEDYVADEVEANWVTFQFGGLL